MTCSTVVCVPHAGGSAAAYRLWVRRLTGPNTRVLVLELPGRGVHRRLPPPSTLLEAVEHLVTVLTSQVTGPYLLVGHSLGALLAFELTRIAARSPDRDRGSRAQLPAPDVLVVSGRNAPTCPSHRTPLHDLPDLAFIAGLQAVGGLPAELLQEPAVLQLFLPALRADLRIAETYHYNPGPPLACPIVALRGQHDPLITGRGISGWAQQTTGPFLQVDHPGDHFAILRDPAIPSSAWAAARSLTSTSASG